MVQWQMRCTHDELDWIDVERAKRGMSRAAFARMALAHLREVMPPDDLNADGILADAVAALDRSGATMTS